MNILNCKICNKEFKDTHYRETSKCCSRECRIKYNNEFGKNELPQRDGKGFLLCYNCLLYKDDNEFNEIAISNKCPISRNRRNTRCKKCYLNKERIYKKAINQTLEGILKSRLNNAKNSSKKRNIEFDNNLSINDLIQIYNSQNGKCALSNEQLIIGGSKCSHTLSIDRINSLIGYTKDNIQLLCWAVNQMKNNLSEEELEFWCNKIIKYAKS